MTPVKPQDPLTIVGRSDQSSLVDLYDIHAQNVEILKKLERMEKLLEKATQNPFVKRALGL